MPGTCTVKPAFSSTAAMACDLRRRLVAARKLLALALASSLWLAGSAQAQDPSSEIFGQGRVEAPAYVPRSGTQIFHPGSMAVTGFSGAFIPGLEEGLPPGVDPVEETFIDTARASLRVFDVNALGGPPSGQLVFTPPPFEVTAEEIGQVFALAYDDGMRNGFPSGVPDLYSAASSLHGIRIVTPDADADGRPERRRRGAAGATFMDGQFGRNNGGGPGSIWRIDGITGAVTRFADIEANSGPGIGDVAFDKAHRQFFASDLDTGLIHRIAADGALVDTFDHGVSGRPAHHLAAVADDGATMDITDAGFDSEDPDTWGYTLEERRVFGLAVNGGRLYYAVGEHAEIWSVGIGRDGAFAADPRWELTVGAKDDLAVTDIVFDNRGMMYLAQRGETQNRFDYSQFANSGKAEVLRYWRESPDDPATASIWTPAPQTYAVGFPQDHRQAAGGVDLQYGYDAQGRLDPSACAETLVETGDRLRDDPALAERLAAGGPPAVQGVQITSAALARPANEPPSGSWFVDFDGFFQDPDVEGHVGDVEVWRPCEGRAGYYEQIPYPGDVPRAVWPSEFPPSHNIATCIDVEAVEYSCTPAGLQANLYIRGVAGVVGDSVKADSRTPGLSVSPLQQTNAPGQPFTLGLSGYLPGGTVDVGLCFYRKSDADKAGYQPCCNVVVPLATPPVSCRP